MFFAEEELRKKERYKNKKRREENETRDWVS
jgi:hypothetical protein